MLGTTADGESSGPGFGGWPAWLGPWLGKLRLHAIEPRERLGRPPMIAKRRRWFSPLLIGPGNLCLRLLGSGVRVLPGAEWQARERTLHRALHGIELETGPRGWLLLPRWPGMVLADHARSRLNPAPARLRGLGAASRALRDLHRVELPHADGGCERLSHGDATLRNVLFDPGTEEARWFDFDTAHAPGLAPAWRHGDDLRALVYSAVESFADVAVADLLRTVRDAYADPAPWEQLRDRLARGALYRSPLHLAQACLPDGRRRELESLLLQGASRRGSLMGDG
ncbi:MAG: hypothetical protein P4L84_24410 [Isosphaeraceae bacterium]|nr:hypothetical protein [Isosphaeraceae bacterium]